MAEELRGEKLCDLWPLEFNGQQVGKQRGNDQSVTWRCGWQTGIALPAQGQGFSLLGLAQGQDCSPGVGLLGAEARDGV